MSATGAGAQLVSRPARTQLGTGSRSAGHGSGGATNSARQDTASGSRVRSEGPSWAGAGPGRSRYTRDLLSILPSTPHSSTALREGPATMLQRMAGRAPSDLSAGGIRSLDSLQRPPFASTWRVAAAPALLAAALLDQLPNDGGASPPHGRLSRVTQPVPIEPVEGGLDSPSRKRMASVSMAWR